MPSTAYFQTLARYNQWANRKLFAALADLPEDELARERQAFFGSILGTVNHILVGDRIWVSRLRGAPEAMPLDTVLHADLADLTAAREIEDARIVMLVDRLEEEDLEDDVVYTNSTGARFATPTVWVLGHFFNHQTHHRGQVHGMLSETQVAPPPLDLIFYLREIGPHAAL